MLVQLNTHEKHSIFESSHISTCSLLVKSMHHQVKAVVSAQAADGTPLPAAEARELKNMALRESPFLQRCFVAASDTDHGRPALGQTLPAG